MSTPRVLRGQPPSPPQSPNSSTTTESKLDSVSLNSLYSNPETLGLTGFNGPPPMKMNHDSDPQSMSYAPNSYFVPNSDYSRLLPIQHPFGSLGISVNTPPPGGDEHAAPNNVESISTSLWSDSKSTPKARVNRTPRINRRAKKTKERSKAKIDTPLSVSTKHLTHIPLRDIDSYVNRPISERKEEVMKRNGRIARPMNSFMLYRSAYAERTKELSSQNNHQIVSETAGDSWKIEPKEIREKYENLANIEKARHLQAHPGYKFAPCKKDKQAGEERSEPDVERDSSPMSSPPFTQVGRGMKSVIERNSWEPDFNAPFDQDHGLPSGSFLGSSWQTGHPGRSFPGMITSEPQTAHFMPTSISPGVLSMQGFQYPQSTPLAGLPGNTHQELLQPQTSMPMPSTYTDAQLDPQLLKRESSSPAQTIYHNGPYQLWQDNPANNYYLPATTSVPPSATPYTVSGYHPGMQRLMDNRDMWAHGQETSLETPGGEFDSWIESNQSGY